MPVLHLVAGPNGAGKSTFVSRVLQPVTHLPFVNADIIAARLADVERQHLIGSRRSFIAETVFSHPSKNDLVAQAAVHGYIVHLYVILLPVDVTVRRVAERVRRGGHDVPEQKVRGRYDRQWRLIAKARDRVDRAEFFDNNTASAPFRRVAVFQHGKIIGQAHWPPWTPAPLLV